MITEILGGITCISLNRDSFISGKSSKDSPNKSRVGLGENLRAKNYRKHSSVDNVKTLNWQKIEVDKIITLF